MSTLLEAKHSFLPTTHNVIISTVDEGLGGSATATSLCQFESSSSFLCGKLVTAAKSVFLKESAQLKVVLIGFGCFSG